MFDYADDILTVEEASDLLKLGTSHTYKLLRNGELAGFKEGKDWKIPKISLEEYVMRKVRATSQSLTKKAKKPKLKRGICYDN